MYKEIPVGRAKDLRGQKFGKLTPLYRIENGDSRPTWLCRCDCGNLTVKKTKDLACKGGARSCGCLNKIHNLRPPVTVGAKYGQLTVLEEGGKSKVGIRLWLCECECGKIVKV